RDKTRGPSCCRRIVNWVFPAQTCGECFQTSLRFFDRQARLKTCDGARKHAHGSQWWDRKGESIVTCGDETILFRLQSLPGMVKARRHHANHLVQVAVETKALAEDVRVCAKLAPPEAVTQHYGFKEPGDIFLLREHAADLRLHAQHREIVRTGCQHFNPLRAVDACQGHGNWPDDRDVLENARAIPVIPKLWDGHPH